MGIALGVRYLYRRSRKETAPKMQGALSNGIVAVTKAATVDVGHGNEMNMRVARCYKERVSMKFLYILYI